MKPYELADQLEKHINDINSYYITKSYVLEKLDENTNVYRKINELQVNRNKISIRYVIGILRGLK